MSGSKKASSKPQRWSKQVTETSDALALEEHVELRSPRAVAKSLERSADASKKRGSNPFRSALSMLVFYINRAGRNSSEERRRTLERAEDELRALYGRPRLAHAPT